MSILEKKTMILVNRTDSKMKVPTLDGKEYVKGGAEFECYKKDGEALLRMYSAYFEKVEEKTIEAKPVKIYSKKKEDKKPVFKKIEKQIDELNGEKTLDELQIEYKEKTGKDIPVNKKNDKKWIQSKL